MCLLNSCKEFQFKLLLLNALLPLVHSRQMGHKSSQCYCLTVILGIPELLKSDIADNTSRLTHPLNKQQYKNESSSIKCVLRMGHTSVTVPTLPDCSIFITFSLWSKATLQVSKKVGIHWCHAFINHFNLERPIDH